MPSTDLASQRPDGVPSSGAYNPKKSDIRALFGVIASAVNNPAQLIAGTGGSSWQGAYNFATDATILVTDGRGKFPLIATVRASDTGATPPHTIGLAVLAVADNPTATGTTWGTYTQLERPASAMRASPAAEAR